MVPQAGDPDVLIVGDLNSSAGEDPIAALESAGYTNLAKSYGGPDAYSYVFDGNEQRRCRPSEGFAPSVPRRLVT